MTDSYPYADGADACSSGYLWPTIRAALKQELRGAGRVFELGCGNGAFAKALSDDGHEVIGVDASDSGIAIANRLHPELELRVGDAYQDLAASYGQFACVVSLEVVEHCYYPRRFATTVAGLLKPGGVALISTPYHGYLKNLAISLVGGWDAHWSPLWDHGHIKFFSRRTLGLLLAEQGLAIEHVARVGRVAPLAKSMIALARKPHA